MTLLPFAGYFRKWLFVCLSSSILLIMATSLSFAEKVKVGVYDNKPLVYQDDQGEFQGLAIDVLRYIAKQEDWDLQFVPGSWPECLHRLEAGEIDLQVAIAISAERKKLFNYSRQTLISNWGRLYRYPGIAIDSLLDLDGKIIAVLEKDIHAEVFTDLMEKFGRNVNLVQLKSYDEVLAQVQAGKADAGIVNRMYAMQNLRRFQVEETPLIFNPIEVGYAVLKGENGHLLQTIDRHLQVLRENKDSVYYHSLEKCFGTNYLVKIPSCIKFILLLVGILFVFVFGASLWLKRKVVLKTGELKKANQQLADQIDQLQKTENELQTEKEFFDVTLRSIGDGVLTTDIEGRVTFLNKVAENLTGWPDAEARGKSSQEVFNIINEKTGKRCTNPILRVIKMGRIIGLANHTALIARDGSLKTIADSGAPIRDRKSKIIGVVIVFRDVTKEQRMEEELLKVRKLDSVGVLAGGIAHDFNNILSAILGNIELARYRLAGKDDRITSLLSDAQKATKRAAKLTQQLLTFSKGGDPIKEATSLPELIKDSADFVLQGSRTSCDYSFAKDLWPVAVDSGQISQVIQNIIINADHAMPEGGQIRVNCVNVDDLAAEALLSAQEGHFVRITIQDSGIGIPREVIDKIFDPYFSTKQHGSGLGLAICYSIINKHDGYLTVDSVPGKGTTFTLYLPAVLFEDSRVTEMPGQVPAVKAGRITVMDDEKILRELIKSQLVVLGHEVVLVADGEQAINKYQELQDRGTPVDLVIMDLTIPGGVGGQEAAQKLLQINPEAKIIVASGYSNDPVVANYRKYGFHAALVKPFDLKELSDVVSAVL